MFKDILTMRATIGALSAISTVALSAAPASATQFYLTRTAEQQEYTTTDAVEFTSTDGTMRVRVRAWSVNLVNFQYTVQAATLGVFTNGLGVGNPRGDSFDTIDNENGFDFVSIQFDEGVDANITGYTINHSSGWGTRDADSTLSWIRTYSPYAALKDRDYINLVNTADYHSVEFPSASNSGRDPDAVFVVTQTPSFPYDPGQKDIMPRAWMIGASHANVDGRIDGFRLNAITVSSGVPEPQTWAMMILGFGVVGAAVRRRPAGRSVRSIA